jgi:hypothetical protein
MELRSFGHTERNVSVIGQGTWHDEAFPLGASRELPML